MRPIHMPEKRKHRVIVWYARGGDIAKSGPHRTQMKAVDAMRLVKGGFPADVFVWPEYKDRRNKR